MKRSSTTNTFSKGMVSDVTPIQSPNKTYVSALNATLTTFDGEELAIQNDKGNVNIKGAELPSGYIPIGSTELGGIIYIVSYNPLNKTCQIGSFPSPEDGDFDNKQDKNGVYIANPEDFYQKSNEWIDSSTENVGNDNIKSTQHIYTLINDYILSPGDKFYLYAENLPITNLYDKIGSKEKENYVKFIPCVIDSNNRVIEMTNLSSYELTPKNNDNDKYNSYINTSEKGKYQIFRSNYSGKLAIKVQLIAPTSFEVEIQDKLISTLESESSSSNVQAYVNTNKTQYNIIIEPKHILLENANIIKYTITPVMQYGALTELSKEIIIDTKKVNSGDSELFAWNYKVTDDTLKLNYGIHTYLNDSQKAVGINLAFYTITDINENQDNSGQQPQPAPPYIPVEYDAYSPIIRCSMSSDQEFHPFAVDVTTSYNKESKTERYILENFKSMPDEISDIKIEVEKAPLYNGITYKRIDYISTNQFSYNGNKTLNIYLKDEFEEDKYENKSPILKKDRLYLTKIIFVYTNDDVTKNVVHYRWLYTNTVFNNSNNTDFNENEINLTPICNVDIQYNNIYRESKDITIPTYMSLEKIESVDVNYKYTDHYQIKYALETTLPNNLDKTFSIPEYKEDNLNDQKPSINIKRVNTISQLGEVSSTLSDNELYQELEYDPNSQTGNISFNIKYNSLGIADFIKQEINSTGIFKPLAYNENTYNAQGFTLKDLKYNGYSNTSQSTEQYIYRRCAVPKDYNAILMEGNNGNTMCVYGLKNGERVGDDNQSYITDENTDGSWEDDAKLQVIYDRLGFNENMYYGCWGYGVIDREEGRTFLFTKVSDGETSKTCFGHKKSVDFTLALGWKYIHYFACPSYDENNNETEVTNICTSLPVGADGTQKKYACMDMRIFLKKQGRNTYVPIFAEYLGNPRTIWDNRLNAANEVVGKTNIEETTGGQNAPFMWFWARLLNSVYIFTKDSISIPIYKATGIKYTNTINFDINITFNFKKNSDQEIQINGIEIEKLKKGFQNLLNYTDDQVNTNNLKITYPKEYQYVYNYKYSVTEQDMPNDYILGTANNIYAIYKKDGETLDKIKTSFDNIIVNPETLYGLDQNNNLEYFTTTYSESGKSINTSDQELIKNSLIIEDGTIKVRSSVSTLWYYIGRSAINSDDMTGPNIDNYGKVDDRNTKMRFGRYKAPRFLKWGGFPNVTFGSPARYSDGLERKKVIQS